METKKTRPIHGWIVIALLLTVTRCRWSNNPPTDADVSTAAGEFLQTLSAGQREQATFPFDHRERRNWHYVPRDRKGLPLKQMETEQRAAAHALLRSVLTTQGYEKAAGIM